MIPGAYGGSEFMKRWIRIRRVYVACIDNSNFMLNREKLERIRVSGTSKNECSGVDSVSEPAIATIVLPNCSNSKPWKASTKYTTS